MNDLCMFDPDRMEWYDLSGPLNGPPPAQRDAAGLAEMAGRLYVFGGYGNAGAAMHTRRHARRLC